MRWGVRRYQNKDGTLTSAGKKRYASDNKEKPKSEQKPKELTLEEKKAQVLKSRSAKMLYENRKLFNYNEMRDQQQLLEMDAKVKSMIVAEPNKVKKFLTEAADYAKKVHDLATPVMDTITKANDLWSKLDPEAKATKAAKEQEELRLKRETANKMKAEKEKVNAETATESERTRQAAAEANKAESELNKKSTETGSMKWRITAKRTQSQDSTEYNKTQGNKTDSSSDDEPAWWISPNTQKSSKVDLSYLLGDTSNSGKSDYDKWINDESAYYVSNEAKTFVLDLGDLKVNSSKEDD